MELYEIRQGIGANTQRLLDLHQSLEIDSKKRELDELVLIQNESNFWDDASHAQRIIKQANGLKRVVDVYETLKHQLDDIEGAYELIKESYDAELFSMMESDYNDFIKAMSVFEREVLLSKPYDDANAIIEIHPGAGGTESQDWASMLYRMYQRYADQKGFKVTLLDYLDGEEAGLKSVSFLVKGTNAYGLLKAEQGVHRLVRISPFDSSGRRHTSFASVDIMPELEVESDIEIKTEDIKIDTYRASGAGGQHVNTTDSAVRMTHVPTGIVVSCQSERSQIKNRETAMKMLKSKLLQRQLQEQEQLRNQLKGEQKDIGWGSQIRSYVFHPYSMVKDHRTDYETSQTGAVMDGDIEGFIDAYLKGTVS